MQDFFVSVDGQFLKTLPSKPNFAPEFLAPVPILLGCTSSEGAGVLKDAVPVAFPSAYSEEEWSDEAKRVLSTFKPSLDDKVSLRVVHCAYSTEACIELLNDECVGGNVLMLMFQTNYCESRVLHYRYVELRNIHVRLPNS